MAVLNWCRVSSFDRSLYSYHIDIQEMYMRNVAQYHRHNIHTSSRCYTLWIKLNAKSLTSSARCISIPFQLILAGWSCAIFLWSNYINVGDSCGKRMAIPKIATTILRVGNRLWCAGYIQLTLISIQIWQYWLYACILPRYMLPI